MQADMAVLTIRNLDDSIKTALRVRAARHGVSMEEEVRIILRNVLSDRSDAAPLGQRLLQRFAGVASDEFELPVRSAPRTPLRFD